MLLLIAKIAFLFQKLWVAKILFLETNLAYGQVLPKIYSFVSIHGFVSIFTLKILRMF